MSDDNKQKSNRRLLLIGVVLLSVIIVGAFGKTEVITTSREKDEQGKVVKITESEQTQFGKIIWNVLELISRLAVPILLAVFGYQVQKRDKEKAEKQAELEREIAQNNLAEEAIQTYLDNMAKLLLNEEYKKQLFFNVNDKLNPLNYDNAPRDIARALTIATLRRLEGDTKRQNVIFRFLRDAELHKSILINAHLSEMNLSGAKLWEFNLSKAQLRKTILLNADLEKANLKQANLEGANLKGAVSEEADSKEAKLKQANLKGADSEGADSKEAKLKQTNLEGANLEGANLEGAKLSGANIQKTFLRQAKNLTPKQIKSAHKWQKAIYIGTFNQEKKIGKSTEPNNTNFTQDLENNKSLDQEKPVDWSIWESNNST